MEGVVPGVSVLPEGDRHVWRTPAASLLAQQRFMDTSLRWFFSKWKALRIRRTGNFLSQLFPNVYSQRNAGKLY